MLSLLRCSRRLGRPLLAVHVCRSVRPVPVVGVTRFLSSVPGRDDSDGTRLDEKTRKPTAGEKKVVAAIKAYKEMYGDTLVPVRFIVPVGDDRWPRNAWGYSLGNAVNQTRQKLKAGDVSADTADELEKLGFVKNVSQYQWDKAIMPALRHFNKLHGHTDVPMRFVVPTGDASWPRPSWGWKLGDTASNIRLQKWYAAQVEQAKEELERLDFCFDISISERNWREKILPSLKVFQDVFHHCIVEHKFKVPAMHPWPEKAWKMRLGRIVNDIRTRQTYVGQSTRDRGILDELGFAWDRDVSIYNERIFPSLEIYVDQHGTCKMRQNFVVPECDPWPRLAWGMNLGKQLYCFKYRGSYFASIGRDVERLAKLGFAFELSERAWKVRVVPLLDTYESIFGDRQVPREFVIPSEAPWPEKMWGVWLGYIVARNSHHL